MTAALLPASALLAQMAFGAGAPATARLERCDSSAYPLVVCELDLRDASGAPVVDATAADVRVRAGGAPARVLALRPLADPAVRMHVSIWVDPGMAARNRAGLVEAAQMALDVVEPGDGIRWRVLGAQAQVDIDNDVPAARNAARGLRTVGQTPLFDALCAALNDEAEIGRRYAARVIVLISDGRDGRSARCGVDDVLALARSGRVPVLGVGVGPSSDARTLNRLAQASGGAFAGVKPSAEDIRAALASLAWRQRARQRLVFLAAPAAGGDTQTAECVVRSAAEELRAEAAYLPVPAIPIVEEPELRVDGGLVSPAALPAGQTISVTPKLTGRGIVRVEYTLGRRTGVVTQPPFAFTLDAAELDPDLPSALTITAYGAEARSPGARVTLLAAENTPAARLLPRPTTQHTTREDHRWSQLAPWAGGIAGSMAVTLLAVAVIAHRARGGGRLPRASYPGQPAMSAQMRHRDAPTVVRGALAQPRTRILDGVSPPPAGRALRLRVLSGALAGREIGLPDGVASLVIGRAPTGPYDVALPSTFLSAAHARLEWFLEGLQVTDLASSNGTRKNGERLPAHCRTRLQAGDRLVLADVELEVLAAA